MQLSRAQRDAVEYLDGPQIILAGSGSGKTRVIVAKARFLLEEKGLSPESLLIITYSTKTMAELEERMSDLNVPEMEIRTFHSFGMELITEFGHLLGLPGEIAKTSEHRLWQYLKQAIGELKESDLLDTNQPESIYYDLKQFISRAKDELITPPEIIARAESELGNLPAETDDEELILARERWTKILEAGRIYESYERIKSGNGRSDRGGIDYGDMIVLAYQLLGNEVARAAMRTRFRHILVDEFQDANFAQVEILRRLTARAGGITVVGDDDQAIYRFRGASFGSFKLFQKLFPGWKVFRLEENYRSQANIVRCAQGLIESDPAARFDADKKMIPVKEPGARVTIRKCPDDISEAQAVALEIERLLRDEKYQQPGSIAVLFRSRRHKNLLVKALRRRNIEFSYDRKEAEITTRPALIMLALYTFAADSRRIDLAPIILNHFLPQMRPELHREINYKISREPGDPLITLGAMATEYKEIAPHGLGNIIEFLKHLRELAVEKTPLQLLERIIAEARIFRFVIVAGKIADLLALREIADILRAAEEYQNDDEQFSHTAFVEYLEWRQSSGGNSDEEPEIDRPLVLQTVHGSKGLEYPVVIMIGLTNRRFPPQKKTSLLEFPHELYRDELPQGDYRIQEERRLFYVGMTRARELLYLYGVEKKGAKISQFIAEMQKTAQFRDAAIVETVPVTDVVLGDIFGPEQALLDHTVSIIIPSGQPYQNTLAETLEELWRRQTGQVQTMEGFEKLKDEFGKFVVVQASSFREGLQNYQFRPPKPFVRYQVRDISYSDLETFKTCPLKFYYRKALAMPSPPEPQQSLGSIIHSILEGAGNALMSGQPLSLDVLCAEFETRWRDIHLADPDRKERLLPRGRELLKRFLGMQARLTGKPIGLEKKFSLELDGVKLVGRIDRIDESDSGLAVIDYKSGKQKSAADLKADLQLPIYSLACHQMYKKYPAKLIYMFLGDDNMYEACYSVAELEQVKAQIAETINEINTGDFLATPGYHCQYCEYRRICPAKQE